MKRLSTYASDLIPVGICIGVIEAGNHLISESLSLWDRLQWSSAGSLENYEFLAVIALYFGCIAAVLCNRAQVAKALFLLISLWALIDLASTTILLVSSLTTYKQGNAGNAMLVDGMLLWALNIATCSLIYWLLDSRSWNSSAGKHLKFPRSGEPDWRESFFDYVFLAFTVSTAYSPTDTEIRTSIIKGLVMIQSTISLLAFTIIVARAVNIVG